MVDRRKQRWEAEKSCPVRNVTSSGQAQRDRRDSIFLLHLAKCWDCSQESRQRVIFQPGQQIVHATTNMLLERSGVANSGK